MSPATCPFCDYHGPSPILFEDREVYVIEPLEPVTPGHSLVIPHRHVEHATIDTALTGAVFARAAWWVDARGMGSANLITSIGAEATQTVPHLHVHVVPRAPGDHLKLPWSPRDVDVRDRVYPPGLKVPLEED